MVWPAITAIGTAMGGAGMLASGSQGLFGNNQQGFSEGGADAIREATKARLYSARTFGEKYGFHPLAALGMSPGSGPIGKATSDKGAAVARMGQGIKTISQAGQSEIQKAQARLLNLQGDAIEKEINNKSPEGQGGVTETELDPPPLMGYAQGDTKNMKNIKPLEQLYVQENGTIMAIPSEDAADYMSESAMANIPYMFKKIWGQMGASKNGFSEKAIIKMRDKLDDMEASFPSPAGWYLRYNYNEGLPQRVRYTGGVKKLVNKPIAGKNPLRYSGMGDWKNEPHKKGRIRY